jgi:hypothetical protein
MTFPPGPLGIGGYRGNGNTENAIAASPNRRRDRWAVRRGGKTSVAHKSMIVTEEQAMYDSLGNFGSGLVNRGGRFRPGADRFHTAKVPHTLTVETPFGGAGLEAPSSCCGKESARPRWGSPKGNKTRHYPHKAPSPP